jgi:hypothetical protein
VRDGAGNPLPGVALNILVTGPPHDPFDNCVTDAAGQCRLLLAPGPYLVQFMPGWRGTLFVDPARQNAAALDDGGVNGGGFGIYLEPAESEQVVTFVVGQRDGQLVPLWDMSRSAGADPQPYLPPESPFSSDDPLADINLSPLMDDGPAAPASPEATEDTQVVESAVESGADATPTPEATIQSQHFKKRSSLFVMIEVANKQRSKDLSQSYVRSEVSSSTKRVPENDPRAHRIEYG